MTGIMAGTVAGGIVTVAGNAGASRGAGSATGPGNHSPAPLAIVRAMRVTGGAG